MAGSGAIDCILLLPLYFYFKVSRRNYTGNYSILEYLAQRNMFCFMVISTK